MRDSGFAGLLSLSVLGGVSGAVMASNPALADHAAVYVAVSRPDVFVVADGRAAPYAIVTDDRGLSRPGAIAPPATYSDTVYGLDRRVPHWRYFPATGKAPRSGRREVIPTGPSVLPRAESYHRSWSSNPLPYNPPPVIAAPQDTYRDMRPLRRRN